MSSSSDPTSPAAFFSGRTAWARSLETPLREFLRTETGGAAVLLAAAVAALVWVNVDASSYDSLWSTKLSIDVGDAGVSLDLRHWVNSGLMTFFFFVVGLEARREFDLGELRERRRVALPLLAGIGGMAGAIGIYLAFNAGRPSAHGWGIAMSTDTAFALGLLALVGPRFPDRLRAFMLTVVVVDDIVALVVIATVYTETLRFVPLLVAFGFFAAVLVVRSVPVRVGLVYFVLGAGAWVAPAQVGSRTDRRRPRDGSPGLRPPAAAFRLSSARRSASASSASNRRADLARVAGVEIRSATSPNERLQQLFHPWTSYVIVPLFALANAGIAIDGAFLARAFSSPITLGILFGYVVGKPVGIVGSSWLAARAEPWPAAAAGRLGGRRRRRHDRRDRLHRLAAGRDARLRRTRSSRRRSSASSAPPSPRRSSRGCCSAPRRCCPGGCGSAPCSARRSRSPTSTSTSIRERDHIRGPLDAPVTLVEYGDFECPYCGQAEPVVRELLRDFGDVRYVWRHLPLTDVHPRAQLAAEAAEAAADQGAFWEMHDLLLDHQDALGLSDLVGYAEQLGLDVERFTERAAGPRRRYPRRRRRRQRRPERRLRYTDLLHQRPPPLRRLRHRDAHRRGAHRPRSRNSRCGLIGLCAARRLRSPVCH